MNKELLQSIENFERYVIKRPLDQIRAREGLPPVTQEEVMEAAKRERKIGEFRSDVRRR